METSIHIVSIIVSCFALILGGAALVLSLAQKFSTHTIQWKALDEGSKFDPFKETDEELLKTEKDEEEFLNKVKELKKKNKVEDPLAEITQTSNF
jgi:hypothetical protein